jgi:superfamily II DNA or RNA helicase
MACGTGKTKVGRDGALARVGSTGLVMVVVPSKWLARQTYLDWAGDVDAPLDALLVYSDPPVGEAAASTDPEIIAEFLNRDTGGLRLLVSTYQSADQVAAAYASTPGLPPVDVMVLDEGHWTAGATGHAYSLPLYDDKIPAVTRLTLTATAKIHPGGDGTQDVVSMDNPELYGERVYELTFGEAIHRKLLADFRVAVVMVTDEEVHQVLLAQEGMPRSEDLSTSQIAAQIAVARAIEKYGSRRIIGFHSRVDRSKAFTRTFNRAASTVTLIPVEALHIDGTTRQSVRHEALQRLAHPADGGATVLSNVAVFTEGVDVPAADAVVFADPKTSKIAIAQAVGRALRLHPEKDQPSVIILPVYLAPGENAEQVLASSEFRHVWAVLSSLRDYDERMDTALATGRIKLGEREFNPEDRDTYLPSAIEILGHDELLHAKLHEAIKLHILTGTTEPWLTRYGKLKAYMTFTGDMPKSDYVTPSGDNLGSFAAAQRAAYTQGTLLPSRQKLLEALPGWQWAKKRPPKIDEEALHAIVREWLDALRDHENPDRHKRLIEIAHRCNEVVPDFSFPHTRYKAYISNAVGSMESLYRRVQRRKTEEQVLDELAPNRAR